MPFLVDFEGTVVRLTDERLRHIVFHPEMATMLHSVGETLLDPDTVVLSSTDPTVRLYYKRYHETGVGDKLVCVVVKLSLEDAFVLTAYLTDKAKRGQALWQRNT